MTLNELVREEAALSPNRYNLVKNEGLREIKKMHNAICKQLVQIADEHKFPMGVLVYIAVSTNAHRPCNFEKCYRSIDTKKALAVIAMAQAVADVLGDKYRTNDKIVHALSRYYDVLPLKDKENLELFKKRMESFDKDKLKKMFIAKDFAKVLFGKDAEYTKGGYLKVIKES